MENSSLITAEPSTLMEKIREEATQRIMKSGDCKGVQAYIERIAQESIVVWLEFFPTICAEVRKVNRNKNKFLQETGFKGRFTNSYGWTENGNFKWEYEYTPELYFFMTNYVFREFFSNENSKIQREFMKRVMRGDDAIETLMWAKKHYGSNRQTEPVVNV